MYRLYQFIFSLGVVIVRVHITFPSFVSGSKDGTVRIWTRSGGTWDHVICNAKTHVVPDRDPKEQIDVLLAQVT